MKINIVGGLTVPCALASTSLLAGSSPYWHKARSTTARSRSPAFREHKRTFGLVYTLPREVNDLLNITIGGLLREKLLNAKLIDEALRFNIPHVTVLHIHNADPTTPEKMLKAVPKLPPVLNVTLKTFYTTEAAKGAGHPWWLDLGIVKEGASFEAMMAFNTIATTALTRCATARCRASPARSTAGCGDAAKGAGADGRRERLKLPSRTARSCARTIRTTRWSTR